MCNDAVRSRGKGPGTHMDFIIHYIQLREFLATGVLSYFWCRHWVTLGRVGTARGGRWVGILCGLVGA